MIEFHGNGVDQTNSQTLLGTEDVRQNNGQLTLDNTNIIQQALSPGNNATITNGDTGLNPTA